MDRVYKATMNFTDREETMFDTIEIIATGCKATRIEINYDLDALRIMENGPQHVKCVEFYFASFMAHDMFIEEVQKYFKERKY